MLITYTSLYNIGDMVGFRQGKNNGVGVIESVQVDMSYYGDSTVGVCMYIIRKPDGKYVKVMEGDVFQ